MKNINTDNQQSDNKKLPTNTNNVEPSFISDESLKKADDILNKAPALFLMY